MKIGIVEEGWLVGQQNKRQRFTLKSRAALKLICGRGPTVTTAAISGTWDARSATRRPLHQNLTVLWPILTGTIPLQPPIIESNIPADVTTIVQLECVPLRANMQAWCGAYESHGYNESRILQLIEKARSNNSRRRRASFADSESSRPSSHM